VTTPLERLLQEAIPLRPDPPAKPVDEPWTPEEQARHWDDDTSLSKRRREQRRTRRLRPAQPAA
jgi:hypothetical protein